MLLQFHAEPDDMADWLQSWMELKDMQMIAEFRGTPSILNSVRKLSADQLAESVASVMISPLPMVDNVAPGHFLENNANFLRLRPGRRTRETLQESILQGTASDPRAASTLRSLVRSTKKLMHKGVVVLNPVTLAEGAVRNHYFTDAALAAARSGVRMTAWGGNNLFKFES